MKLREGKTSFATTTDEDPAAAENCDTICPDPFRRYLYVTRPADDVCGERERSRMREILDMVHR